MKQTFVVLLMTAAFAVLPGAAAHAATVTFDTIGGSNGDAFTTVTEDGVTVNSNSGLWRKAYFVGNPVPGLFTFADTAALEIVTGGLFFFGGFDLGTGGASNPRFTFEGFLEGVPLYSRSGGGSGAEFQTVTNPDDEEAVDRVIITTFLTSSSANVDNVVVDFAPPVPEPATVTLLALGGLAALRARRRR